MHKFGERCDLVQEGGRVTDPAIDKRMDFHFNALLDVVSEWRKDKTQLQDVPLGGTWRRCCGRAPVPPSLGCPRGPRGVPLGPMSLRARPHRGAELPYGPGAACVHTCRSYCTWFLVFKCSIAFPRGADF